MRLDEELEMYRGLLAARKAGRIPPLYVDCGRIALEVAPGCRRRIGIQQAKALAAGASLSDVLHRDLNPADRSWQARRRRYLRESGRAL